MVVRRTDGAAAGGDEPDAAWVAYRAAPARCALRHPADWVAAEGDAATIVAFVAAPRADGAFASNLSLVVEAGRPGLVIDELAAGHAAALTAVLGEAHLLEAGVATVGGRPASHVLLAHREGEYELTLEQWLVPCDGQAVVLSASTDNQDHADDADVVAEIVASVTFHD